MSPLRIDRCPWRAPHPDRVIALAGLLACGSRQRPGLPILPVGSTVACPASLSAHSCGGSRRFDPSGPHCVPFSSDAPKMGRRNQSTLGIARATFMSSMRLTPSDHGHDLPQGRQSSRRVQDQAHPRLTIARPLTKHREPMPRVLTRQKFERAQPDQRACRQVAKGRP